MAHNRMSSFGTRITTGVVAALLAALLVACGTQESGSSTTSAETHTAAAQETSMTKETSVADARGKKVEEVVGAKATNPSAIGNTSSDAIKARLTNGLGTDISSFEIRKVGETDWTQLLKENETIKAGGVVELGIAAGEKGAKFDVALQCADNTQVTLDALDISAMLELTVNMEDSVGYATFKDAAGNEGTTKKTENDAEKTEEEARPYIEETKASDDGASADVDAASDEEYVEDTSDYYGEPPYEDYYEPEYDYGYSEPVVDYSYSAPEPQVSAPQQNTDGCLDDVVLRY